MNDKLFYMRVLFLCLFLFLTSKSNAQEPIQSLSLIQGVFSLDDLQHQALFHFNKVEVIDNHIILFLNDSDSEKFKFKNIENQFLVFEKIYTQEVVGPETTKIKLKISALENNNLSVSYLFQGTIVNLLLTKIN
jgi:hypothetical protein